MKNKIPIAALVLLLVSIAVSIVMYRPPLGNSLWCGYRVLYVPFDVPEETTLKICAESGVGAVITGTEPEMPFIAPLTMPLASPFTLKTDYPARRQGFFTDKDKNYRLYYLPDNTDGKFRSLLADFRSDGISGAGIDIPEAYLWIIPAVVFFVLCVFIFLAKARLVLFAGGIPMLLFSAVMPQYPAGAAACLFLYSLFLLQKVWLRRGFVSHWASRVYGPLFAILAAGVCFVFSVKCGFLFLLNTLGSASSLFILAWFAKQRKHPAFLPVKIRPAALVPTDTIKFSGIPMSGILVLGIFFAFQAFFFPISGKKGLYLPAPSRYTEVDGFTTRSFAESEAFRLNDANELPDLRSFIIWVWNTLVFPYRSLNVPNEQGGNLPPAPGTVISVPMYKQTNSGIVETDKPVYVFDDAFVTEVLAAIDDASFEQVLKAQGQFTTVSYMALEDGQKQQDPLILVLLAAAAAVSPVAALTFIIRKALNERGT
jgi:hypothetical protein